MIDNKYFKRDYEEQYYIFDSRDIKKEEALEILKYDYSVCSYALTGKEVLTLLNNGLHDCENCHHYNSLITPTEGVFEQCMVNNRLWCPCNDYDPIETGGVLND